MGNSSGRESGGGVESGSSSSKLERKDSSVPVSNPRKHSTVSLAKLPFYQEKIDWVTENQKELIRTSWKRVEDDVARVGVITFIQLFNTHPDVKQVFMPFNGLKIEELQHSKQLRAHALRVMAFVQKAVARLDEKEKIDKLLEELGANHFYYGAPKKYLDKVGPQFIKAIEPSLTDIWSKEMEQAWLQLFSYIAYQMKDALSIAEKSGKSKRGSK